MVLATVRDDDPDAIAALRDLMAELERGRRLERVALGALEAGRCRGARVGVARRPRWPRWRTRGPHSGGNPLFVEELARHVGETEAPEVDLAAASTAALPSG